MLPPWTPQEREEFLGAFMEVDWLAEGHQSLAVLGLSVTSARADGAKAIARYKKGDEQAARRHYDQAMVSLRGLLRKVAVDLETERVEVPRRGRRSGLPGDSFYLYGVTRFRPAGRGSVRDRLTLPVRLSLHALDLASAIGLAALEELARAKSYGHCAYCNEWWLSPDERRRTTCGKARCDSARKRDWRQQNPEPTNRVAERVRRHRKKARKKQRRGSIRARGATSVKARTR